MIKHVLAIALVALTTAMLSGCGSRTDPGVIVAGSTSVQPYAELLAEEYAHLHPGSLVDVQGGGSSAGITAAMSGTADIGMSSRELKASELDMWHVKFAKDGLAVIINPANPIGGLRLEQVLAIYAADIDNWSAVGGPDAKIHLIAREDGSGTRDAFQSLVMGSSEISPRAIIQDSNGSVRLLVSGDPHAVGFISLGLVDDTVKALRLDGIAPTSENVTNGSYSLYRPFFYVSNGEPEGLAKHFVDFTLSPEGQKLLIEEGLVPLHQGE